MALTPKQEKYCQGIASGMNSSTAYRAAYSCDNMLDATVNNNAYMLSNLSEIVARIEQLQKPIAERVGRTLEQHIARLMELSKHGESLDKVEASIKAEELVGKVLGYYVNKTELTGRGGGPIEHKVVREIIDPVSGDDSY